MSNILEMKKILLFFLLILSINKIYSQSYTISGYITDSSDGEKLIGALIYELNSKTTALTNEYGYFSMSFTKVDTVDLVVKYTGYSEFQKKIYLNKDIKLDVQLERTDKEISRIIISQESRTENNIGQIKINSKQISLIPSIGGENDLLKALQLMPGVMQGQDGKSGLYIRGGSPDQNLILLDDIPLYYVGHLGGFFSVFNNDAINSVKLIKGSIPAKYGGRLSSVLDIRLKDGDLTKYHFSATTGFISSKVQINGPIVKNKISFLFSARRSWLDILHPVMKIFIDNDIMNYKFYDVNCKIRYKINDHNNIYLSFYTGDDKLKTKNENYIFTDRIEQLYGNFAYSFRWNHIYSSKLFSNFTIAYSKFRYSNNENISFVFDSSSMLKNDEFYSSLADVTSKLHYQYYINNNVNLNFGLNTVYHNFLPAKMHLYLKQNNTVSIDTNISNNPPCSFETAFYSELKLYLFKFVTTNLGVRLNNYSLSDKNYFSVEPRILLSFYPAKNTKLKMAYTNLKQNIHRLTFSGLGLYSDLWVPSTNIIPPENVWQTSVGLEQKFNNSGFSLNIEAYYKKMDNLLDFGYGTFWDNAIDWEQKSEKNGQGIAYGVEAMLSKNKGVFSGWISYTYSKSKRRFENINSGNWYDYDYDCPNNFKIFILYKYNSKLNISADWVYRSARPINIPFGSMASFDYFSFVSDGTFSINGQKPFFYEKNSIRLKSYHHLDVAINYTIKKNRTIRTWTFSIYNVYNRQNAFYYFFVYEKQQNTEKYIRKLYQQSLFPIIPSVSYSIKF